MGNKSDPLTFWNSSQKLLHPAMYLLLIPSLVIISSAYNKLH